MHPYIVLPESILHILKKGLFSCPLNYPFTLRRSIVLTNSQRYINCSIADTHLLANPYLHKYNITLTQHNDEGNNKPACINKENSSVAVFYFVNKEYHLYFKFWIFKLQGITNPSWAYPGDLTYWYHSFLWKFCVKFLDGHPASDMS